KQLHRRAQELGFELRKNEPPGPGQGGEGAAGRWGRAGQGEGRAAAGRGEGREARRTNRGGGGGRRGGPAQGKRDQPGALPKEVPGAAGEANRHTADTAVTHGAASPCRGWVSRVNALDQGSNLLQQHLPPLPGGVAGLAVVPAGGLLAAAHEPVPG